MSRVPYTRFMSVGPFCSDQTSFSSATAVMPESPSLSRGRVAQPLGPLQYVIFGCRTLCVVGKG